MDIKLVGNFIAEKRKSKNLTQVQLAKKLMVSDKAVSKWESGGSLPEIENLIAIAKEFSVTVDDILQVGNQRQQPIKKFELFDNTYENKYINVGILNTNKIDAYLMFKRAVERYVENTKTYLEWSKLTGTAVRKELFKLKQFYLQDFEIVIRHFILQNPLFDPILDPINEDIIKEEINRLKTKDNSFAKAITEYLSLLVEESNNFYKYGKAKSSREAYCNEVKAERGSRYIKKLVDGVNVDVYFMDIKYPDNTVVGYYEDEGFKVKYAKDTTKLSEVEIEKWQKILKDEVLLLRKTDKNITSYIFNDIIDSYKAIYK